MKLTSRVKQRSLQSLHIKEAFVVPEELNENEKDLINSILNDSSIKVC
jgi:hypothetical protein